MLRESQFVTRADGEHPCVLAQAAYAELKLTSASGRLSASGGWQINARREKGARGCTTRAMRVRYDPAALLTHRASGRRRWPTGVVPRSHWRQRAKAPPLASRFSSATGAPMARCPHRTPHEPGRRMPSFPLHRALEASPHMHPTPQRRRIAGRRSATQRTARGTSRRALLRRVVVPPCDAGHVASPDAITCTCTCRALALEISYVCGHRACNMTRVSP